MVNVRFHENRFWKWILGIVGLLFLLLTALSYLVNIDALREYAERRINRQLKGFTVRVGKAYFHPIGPSLDLDEIVLIQNEYPDPPIAGIKRFHASVNWLALIKGRLVGDILIERPQIYLNLKHFRTEESETAFEKEGWQDALEAVFPLKINVMEISNGELTYVDQGPYQPLHVGEVYLRANNIRNIFSPENTYPSPVKLRATIFEKGKLNLDGFANFLQKPRLGFKGAVDLREMGLGYFTPITKRQNIFVHQGTFSAQGSMEFARENSTVHLQSIEIEDLDADYELRPETAAKKEEQVQKATETAKEMSNAPTAQIRIDLLKITRGTLGYLNRTTEPTVRIYTDQIEATLKDFSNQIEEGASEFQMRGRFLGSGDTNFTGRFRPVSKSPNLDLKLAITDVDMRAMGSIFQAYGKFDIKGGNFSIFSEMAIRNDRVQGYVKPIFKNMEVTDMGTDEEKSLFDKLYTEAVSGIAEILENEPRQEVATEIDISGPLKDPEADPVQIIINLIKNAFFKAILPGFRQELNQENQ
ncbi:MAG: DUF748 domain-containing protein [Desulfurivibrionaceae bacterium]